jgi:hypothetical protein
MAVFVIIITACLIVALNVGVNGRKNAAQLKKQYNDGEISDVPVARVYKVLYWYVIFHFIYAIVIATWAFMSDRPWKKFTPQYVADHHLHESIHTLQMHYKIWMLVYILVPLALYTYVAFAKRMKAITTILWIFVALDVLSLPSSLSKPTYELIFDLAASAFTFLVLWSLIIKEPNLLKLLHVKEK